MKPVPSLEPIPAEELYPYRTQLRVIPLRDVEAGVLMLQISSVVA